MNIVNPSTLHSLRSTQASQDGPRILFVTPEISYVPKTMGPGAESIRAKAGGMAEVSALLVERLHAQGADVHLALPHYRDLFELNGAAEALRWRQGDSRIHLAEDAAFYRNLSAYHGNLLMSSLAFQREVINHIIPAVQPDIVHCNDWMTGLIPAACRELGIKTVFTIHNIHRELTTLAEIEDRGIDTTPFWQKLHYENEYPYDFSASYHHNAIDLLSSAIINADYVTTVSPTFLQEIIHAIHGNLPESTRWDLLAKIDAGYAQGILNAPAPSFDPSTDPHIAQTYSAEDHLQNKGFNKVVLQKKLGLTVDHHAPVLFWPSRLDPVQKGCQLLTEILYQLISDYEQENLQLVLVADGAFKGHFEDIVAMHGLQNRVGISSFEESLSHQGFAGADFVLMPSSFEPCGLPQMIGARYGTLPIAHNTGGLHDTVEHFAEDLTTGNGFLFDYFDCQGLRWAIDRALDFHRLPSEEKTPVISRIMEEADQRFHQDNMFGSYQKIYDLLDQDQTKMAQPIAIPA